MASHPYISGPGNVSQMIGFLRKNFPATVTADTVRKLGLASNNESYVINVLQFLKIIDEAGKRTDVGLKVLTTHNEDQFKAEFGKLVKEAYADLFGIRGDEAWTMSKNDLIGYFRSADKTSEIIGSRQAGVFIALSELAGYSVPSSTGAKSKPSASTGAKKPAKKSAATETVKAAETKVENVNTSSKSKGDMAFTVRIEINLPAEGTAETYDTIFKSIRANLFP
ncbi:DUF5343 domain-containing protein [Bradyrhizobium sp. SZCCHNR2035]|uniref:DUF5343 domain-containing protein n=1 Tax=Bradyrhizobium sp. SZCCHNR2035 TaxID=3057386 RepID=UPI002916B389|nr:DUF5343 domain-containing protein [Bradyrhizobium sp. SZCCHNR2035]